MKAFMGEDFLLDNETAKILYHRYAAKMPIIDYHCHINPAEIAQDRRFETITQVWLGGDHYKWRLMRACGVDERYITGDASDYDKFRAFARVLPLAAGNPVYHWSHLELRRYFGCDMPLSEQTAGEVWDICNTRLKEKDFSVRSIIKSSCVTAIVTTDDPVDSLEHHEAIQGSSFGTKVYPGWRPDKLLYIERNEFLSYVEKLRQAAEVSIDDMEGLKNALHNRLDFFEARGCRASDHGINEVVYAPASDKEVDTILKKRLKGSTLTIHECNVFRYSLMQYLGHEYAKRGWVMEIHFGALRNNNTGMFKLLGPDTGYDCINNCTCISGLVAFMDSLEQEGRLPKTIVFSLNPNDNAAIVSAINCFSEAGVWGKVQHGPAWWFNDNKAGMEQQLINLANMSVLGTFVGMLTDSRSFLSYTRHEYFRRILCNLLGGWMEAGEYPRDNDVMGKLVEDVSYNNAMRYFSL